MINVTFSKEDIDTRKFKDQYNKKIINVFEKFVSICEIYNLKYILGYGSVLGAVRHNGIIPWDDDIDICMPRPDYECFLDICRTNRIDGYEAYIINETDYYYEPYAKFADSNTSLVYNKNVPYVCGVMIDIFPIDGAASNEQEWKKDSDKYNKLHRVHQVLLSHHTVKSLWNMFINGAWRHTVMYLLLEPFKGVLKGRIWKMMQNIEQKYKYEDSNWVAFYHRVYGYKDRIPKRWIEERINHIFEDTNAYIPHSYEDYLKHFYGDYMQIPPLEARDKHPIDYINLSERKSLSEILKLIDEYDINR